MSVPQHHKQSPSSHPAKPTEPHHSIPISPTPFSGLPSISLTPTLLTTPPPTPDNYSHPHHAHPSLTPSPLTRSHHPPPPRKKKSYQTLSLSNPPSRNQHRTQNANTSSATKRAIRTLQPHGASRRKSRQGRFRRLIGFVRALRNNPTSRSRVVVVGCRRMAMFF